MKGSKRIGADRYSTEYPITPDARYFVVRGRLWRLSNPMLDPHQRERLVRELMSHRRQVWATAIGSPDRIQVRARIDATKRGLGERGPVWWDDGAPDYNRYNVGNTPYREWYLVAVQGGPGNLESSCRDGAVTKAKSQARTES